MVSVPICIVYSVLFGYEVTASSLLLATLIFVYNELKASTLWAPRNLLNGLAYALFEAGATVIASTGGPFQAQGVDALDNVTIAAVCISLAVNTTTIFAQDFQDVDGDTKAGRTTIPMLLNPTAARSLLCLLLTIWSAYLAHFWALGIPIAMTYVVFSAAIGGMFLLRRSTRDDEVSYYWYNVSILNFDGFFRIRDTH